MNELKLRTILTEIMSSNLKFKGIHKLDEIFDFENKELPKIHEIGNIFEFEVDIHGEHLPIYASFALVADSKYVKLPPLLAKYGTMYEITYGFDLDQLSTQIAITDLKTISYIMYVLVEICKRFISRENPDILLFFADSKDGTIKGEMQKVTMYREITRKYLPNGYVMFEKIRNDAGKTGFLIYKRDNFHGKNRLK